jgi:hypothetical protein
MDLGGRGIWGGRGWHGFGKRDKRSGVFLETESVRGWVEEPRPNGMGIYMAVTTWGAGRISLWHYLSSWWNPSEVSTRHSSVTNHNIDQWRAEHEEKVKRIKENQFSVLSMNLSLLQKPNLGHIYKHVFIKKLHIIKLLRYCMFLLECYVCQVGRQKVAYTSLLI